MLRAARKLAGVSGERLAAQLAISQSKLSRIELGQSAVAPELARRWTAACELDQERAEEINALAERIATDVYPAPWHGRIKGGVARLQRDVADLEATGRLHLDWHPRLVQGLLQTPAYAREIIAGAHPHDPELSAAVAARMARQSLLYDPTTTLRFLIGEAALRWPIATVPALIGQLDRLLLFASDGTVDFGIVPFEVPFGAFSYHAWSILAERDHGEPDLVEIGLETAKVDITDPEQTAAYRDAFERMSVVALKGDAAVSFIRGIRQELRARL
nr:helix-turn-helix transcriptional regulator [Kribbella jejuensis]